MKERISFITIFESAPSDGSFTKVLSVLARRDYHETLLGQDFEETLQKTGFTGKEIKMINSCHIAQGSCVSMMLLD